jgi:hypothetical protein
MEATRKPAIGITLPPGIIEKIDERWPGNRQRSQGITLALSRYFRLVGANILPFNRDQIAMIAEATRELSFDTVQAGTQLAIAEALDEYIEKQQFTDQEPYLIKEIEGFTYAQLLALVDAIELIRGDTDPLNPYNAS